MSTSCCATNCSCVNDTGVSLTNARERPGIEPYYPINDEKNGKLYERYKSLADGEEKVIFGGRLGQYRYFDMDAVIASALDIAERELN